MTDLITELQLKIERLENEINFRNGLISILSHDSKELFGNFLRLAEALEQKFIDEVDFFKLLPEVKSDAEKNLQTVQDSTSWLKTQYGKFEIKPSKIMVMDLFQRLEEKYAAKLEDKNITCSFKGDPNSSLTTDRLLLEFVLDKILNNAVKYSFPNKEIHLKAFTEGEQAILSVIDFGTGMQENYLSSIYTYDNPIFQGTSGEKGAGLSLKIVQNFISLMGGNIEITSSERNGTAVSVFLPNFKT